jgi:hypothetical protein
MSIKPKIWLLLLLLSIALTYILSPPRKATIQINAAPEGIQEFYIEVTSSKPNLHGTTVKNVYKGLIPVNQKITVPLNQEKTLWFGNIHARAFHPEYYQESADVNNSYIFITATFLPTTWKKILASEEKLVTQQVYRPDTPAYRDLPISHLNYHLWFVKENIIGLQINNDDKKLVQKSFDAMNLNTDTYIKGILEGNMGEYGETKEMKDEIEKARNLINEIHQKIN